jgi:hypothetical protein
MGFPPAAHSLDATEPVTLPSKLLRYAVVFSDGLKVTWNPSRVNGVISQGIHTLVD